jgi:Uma2 family endonuclease
MTPTFDAPITSLPTLADTLAQLSTLGDIPAERILMWPLPGTASIHDLTHVHTSGLQLVELIDGVLVEKAVGALESLLALRISFLLAGYLEQHDLGRLLGPDGMLQLRPGIVRLPDVSFISWQRMPRGADRDQPIWPVAPDLAIEVLGPSNTPAEMDRKIRDYFQAGTRLVWIIDRTTRSAEAYTAPDAVLRLAPDGILDGGDVLPGFQLSLTELFLHAEAEGPVS